MPADVKRIDLTSQALTLPPPKRFTAEAALQGAAGLWFIAAMSSQWAFLYYIVVFYGPSTSVGHFQAWNRNPNLLKGYVPGDLAGNIFFAAHVLLAAIISFGGAFQLIPQLCARSMPFHRWNGRLFMVTAYGISLDGLYLVWVRHSSSGPLGSLAISLNAALIVCCVTLAWRKALMGEIAVHRRWALRGYMVANGQWFFRVGVFGMMLLAKPLVEPFFVFWGFGCYLVPLAVLEAFLLVKSGGGPTGRFTMAGGLTALAGLTTLGTIGVYLGAWRPLL